MANTYSQIYIQVVFAVYGRQSLIGKEWREALYKYISGIVRNNDQKLIAIGGVDDHIHILLGIKPNCELSKLVQEIKANSSRWVKEQRFIKSQFQWQEGFGAFSYSRSHLATVAGYIQGQEEHHKAQSFKQEYITLLQRFEIDFDERYIFNFIDEGRS